MTFRKLKKNPVLIKTQRSHKQLLLTVVRKNSLSLTLSCTRSCTFLSTHMCTDPKKHTRSSGSTASTKKKGKKKGEKKKNQQSFLPFSVPSSRCVLCLVPKTQRHISPPFPGCGVQRGAVTSHPSSASSSPGSASQDWGKYFSSSLIRGYADLKVI